MRRIREILLTQYIGAITIGFIFAQGVIQFINVTVQIGSNYWASRQASQSALVGSASFPWNHFILSMTSIALNLLAGFLLIRWLYATETSEIQDDKIDEDSGVPEA
ncbi:MAG: hypothetical protein LAO30_19510 [Acidobacteriia bacterium]|nr:hypothetical protein [Terriglobia bacterium]